MSEEALWPTLGESQDIHRRKKSEISGQASKYNVISSTSSNESPSFKSRRYRRGIPVSPEKQHEMFGLEKSRYKGIYLSFISYFIFIQLKQLKLK